MELTILYIVIVIFGIIIGSFLNVCIFRIPGKSDIVSKRSHCLSCGNVLNWYELIPLVSFMIQGGKCRHCGRKISLQYPLIELSNAVVYVWMFSVHGFTMRSILFSLCGSVLIVISMIDWKTFEIPVGCNIFIGVLGAIRFISDLAHWHSYVIGFFSVSGMFFLIYLLTIGRGIGGGDIKLMAAAGFLMGWEGAVMALIIGSVAGSVIHITLMRIKKKERVLAFGPYLSLGIFIAMLYGDLIIDWYLQFYR